MHRLSAGLMIVALLPGLLGATTINTVTLGDQSFDFSTQTLGASVAGGDLYYLSSVCGICNPADTMAFWANNVGQRGLLGLGPVPLLSIDSIPMSGYTRFGVDSIIGHSYISLAQQGEEGNFIFFTVTNQTTSSVTLDWIYASSAPASSIPEPSTFMLLTLGLAAISMCRRHMRKRA